MTRDFQVSTNRTGIHRVVRVRLYDTLVELRDAHAAAYPDDDPGVAPVAWYDPRREWVDRDPRPVVGRMHLPLDQATVTLIAHEATHAAAHIYMVDGYREHARATAHLTPWNETLAYLVGDITGEVCGWIVDHDIALTVGRPRDYADDEHPAHLHERRTVERRDTPG